jgi:hypothetical protein
MEYAAFQQKLRVIDLSVASAGISHDHPIVTG